MLKRQTRHRPLSDVLELGTITKYSSELRQLIRQAEKNESIDSIVEDVLPIMFRGLFQVTSLAGSTLTLTCSSAALATRFRFEQDSILRLLQARFGASKVRQISIRIRPISKSKARIENNRSISKQNAQLLLEEAGRTKDPSLQQALEKLARRSENL
jgi:hypothetical protein